MAREIGCKWLYSSCFVVYCFLDTAFLFCSYLAFSPCVLLVVSPYSSMDKASAGKKCCFILLNRSDFHMIDKLSVAFDAFAGGMLMSISVDEMLPTRDVNWSISFRGLQLRVEVAPFRLKHTYSVLFVFI